MKLIPIYLSIQELDEIIKFYLLILLNRKLKFRRGKKATQLDTEFQRILLHTLQNSVPDSHVLDIP